MINFLRNHPLARYLNQFIQWANGLLVPAMLRRRTLGTAAIASLLAIIYWGIWASDRYVSVAHVVMQRTDLASTQSVDFSSLLTGTSVNNRSDQLLLADYLLSVDMMQNLDARLDMRSHYSDTNYDIISRMWQRDEPLELFYRHYRSRVSVTYDELAGVLVIEVQAYTPDMAHAIASAMVDEGEKYMNFLGHQLAQEQVAFLEQQVSMRADEALKTRQKLLAFQNDKALVSPQATVESMTAAINQMQNNLTELKTLRSTRLGYLSPSAPSVVELDLQIKAIERQITKEQSRLTSRGGRPLNEILEEYQRLEIAALFAQDTYKTALSALESGRLEATRTLKKVSIISKPTLPQYSTEPRRLYNIIVFMLITLMIAGVVHLIAAIIRDHKD